MAYVTSNPYEGDPPPYGFAVQPSSDASKFDRQYQPQQATPSNLYQTSHYSAQPTPATVTYSPPPVVLQPARIFLGHSPQTMQCPSCQQMVLTRVHYETGGLTWLVAGIICVFGGIFGCCLIPFCVPACQDAIHTCPNCNYRIGRHSPF